MILYRKNRRVGKTEPILFEIGIEYEGDISESTLCVFYGEDEARRYIKRAAVKIMLRVPERNYPQLIKIAAEYFGGKKPEEITNADVDALDEKKIDMLYKRLYPLQDPDTAIKGVFYDRVEYFTDTEDNRYTFKLIPVKK